MSFRTFMWLDEQPDVHADAYTFTIMLSVCSNLIPRDDHAIRFENAAMLFSKCCEYGYLNDHVLWKLKLALSEQEYFQVVGAGPETKSSDMDPSWSRTVVMKRSQDRHGWGRNRHRDRRENHYDRY